MFKKLKLKFILTNIITSASVILIAFSSIYVVALNTGNERDDKREFNPATAFPDFKPQDQYTIENRFNTEIAKQIKSEREASLRTLLISLIISGVAVEAIVALLSIYLAEQSVKPVRDAYKAQKDFIANASHEIKTPLAVIQANLEAADIKNNKWLDNAAKKAEDLAELNNQLLDLARSESFAEEIKQTDVNFEKIVMDCIDSFQPKADKEGKSVTFSFDVPKGYKARLNKKAFEQILNIYLDNGVKYAKNTISVNAKKNYVAVISDGKPISENKLPHLFDRFYQADKASEGVGLGLAIAKSLAKKNGWKVYAKVDEDHKTNIFYLEFK